MTIHNEPDNDDVLYTIQNANSRNQINTKRIYKETDMSLETLENNYLEQLYDHRRS